jgi:hypothetical protein
MGLNCVPALKKNHDAMEQIGKPFVQRYKRHEVRSDTYHQVATTAVAAAQQASRRPLLLLRA